MNMASAQFTRRKFFLHSAAAATVTLAHTPFLRSANEPAHTIGLGFSLYGTKALSLKDALAAIAAAGYDCVELPVMSDWPAASATFAADQRAEFREQLAQHKLRLSALMENVPAVGNDSQHRANLERLERAAQVARDLVPGAHPPIETILGGKAGEFESLKQRLVERLKDYAATLAPAGVTLAIKAHISNATQRPEQLVWLLDQVASPYLKAAYDYSHFELQDLPLAGTADQLLPRAVFMHVKDTEQAQGKRSFLLPGEGTTDYVALFRRLAASNYRGDVVVEVSSQLSNRPGYDPVAAIGKCYNHLATAFEKAGLKRG